MKGEGLLLCLRLNEAYYYYLETMKTDRSRISRRDFLRNTAVAAAAFNIVPGSVLGLKGATPASERLNIAGIGIGGPGGQELRPNTTEKNLARCDPGREYRG